MICYPVGLNEQEIKAISDYWLLSDDSHTEFEYTIKQIDEYYKCLGARPVSFLIRKSNFAPNHPAFICYDCKQKIPAQNRRDYNNKKNVKESVCQECNNLKTQRLIDSAHTLIKEYKAEQFKPGQYLEALTADEHLALLSVSLELSENQKFLGASPDEILITGVQSLDQQLFISLLRKKALIYIPEVPPEVEIADSILYGKFRRVTYDSQHQGPSRYRHPDSVYPGVYLNMPANQGELTSSGVSSLLHQSLRHSTISIDEANRIRHIIKEVQVGKLYQLLVEISKEYEIPIENSNPLRALLDHLAEKYAPQNIYYTFRVKARDTIVHLHRERVPAYIEKRLFKKFVGDYIQYIENKMWGLKRAWSLPPRIQTSPFEALFSKFYLYDHFDWNRLSAKEIVALWLKNAYLSADAQELLIDSTQGNSTSK